MAKVYVSIKNQGGKNFEAQMIKEIQIIAARDIQRIAEHHEGVIKAVIENKTAGGTGKLADTWEAGEMNIPGKIAWGVGDIIKLNSESPHWRHQNWGSIAIGANWQHFLPKGMWVNGRWIENSAGYAGIMPKTPIPALNYLEDSIFLMEPFIQKVLNENK
jgi:hypothetical protein